MHFQKHKLHNQITFFQTTNKVTHYFYIYKKIVTFSHTLLCFLLYWLTPLHIERNWEWAAEAEALNNKPEAYSFHFWCERAVTISQKSFFGGFVIKNK